MTPREAARIRRAAESLRRLLPRSPRVGVVLGSGQGDVDLGEPELEIPFVRVLDLPRPRVKGHAGLIHVCGPALVLRGRVHLYEQRPVEEVVRGVRVLAALGVETLILANAAGGLDPVLRPGDLMLISDHLNLTGVNPLSGGPNFLGLEGAYDPVLRSRLRRRFKVREGVYAAVPGPTYETPAEARMLRRLGADAAGMSTVPEVIAARAAGLRVLAVSVITNAAGGKGLTHAEVLSTGSAAAGRLGALLRAGVDEACRDRVRRGRP